MSKENGFAPKKEKFDRRLENARIAKLCEKFGIETDAAERNGAIQHFVIRASDKTIYIPVWETIPVAHNVAQEGEPPSFVLSYDEDIERVLEATVAYPEYPLRDALKKHDLENNHAVGK